VTDVNHCLSKRLVESEFKVFVLEDLTGIRKRTGARGKGSKKQRKHIGSWSFHQFEYFLTYKAEAAGKTVMEVGTPGTPARNAHAAGTRRKPTGTAPASYAKNAASP